MPDVFRFYLRLYIPRKISYLHLLCGYDGGEDRASVYGRGLQVYVRASGNDSLYQADVHDGGRGGARHAGERVGVTWHRVDGNADVSRQRG